MNSTTVVCVSCLLCVIIVQVLCQEEISSGSGTDANILPPNEKRKPSRPSNLSWEMCKIHPSNCRDHWPGMYQARTDRKRPYPSKKKPSKGFYHKAWSKHFNRINNDSKKPKGNNEAQSNNSKDPRILHL